MHDQMDGEILSCYTVQTRMHSSRMRTVRRSSRLAGGCLPRGVSVGGVCTPPPLWTAFLTHACENITFPQLRSRMVMKLCECTIRIKIITAGRAFA